MAVGPIARDRATSTLDAAGGIIGSAGFTVLEHLAGASNTTMDSDAGIFRLTVVVLGAMSSNPSE